MKFGIISDVHGNLVALDAVLKRLQQEKIDKVICLGDTIGIGPYPDECLKRLMEIKDKLLVVQGNHEGYFLNGLPETVHDNKIKFSEEEIAHHEWIWSQLSEQSIQFIRQMEISKIIDAEGKKIYVTHYPMRPEVGYKKHYIYPTTEQMEELFDGIEADAFLFGHTHVEVANHKTEKWYINPGSLGCAGSRNYATFGILEIREEKMNYRQMAEEYDLGNVIDSIRKMNYPHAEKNLKIFYGVTF